MILSVTNLTRRYDDRVVVDDLSFHVTPGRAFGLLGPNGAGKTTTVRLLNGLIAPSSGTITVFGETLTARNAARLRERIGVQTDTELYTTLTARENLTTWGELYGLRGRRLASRVSDILDIMQLTSRADTLVGGFSKGMRQKVAVGRALIHEPGLLYLDEPTAGLDPEATADLISYLTDMMARTNTTVVFCTHQLHGLEALCDDVGIMIAGHMAVSGPIDELRTRRWPHPIVRFRTADPATTATVLSGIAGVLRVDVGDDVIATCDDQGVIAAAVAALIHQGINVFAVEPERPSLQDLYFATVTEARAQRAAELQNQDVTA